MSIVQRPKTLEVVPPPDDRTPLDSEAPDAPPASEPPPKKSRIEIIDSAAIFAPLEEPDYLINPVIRRGSVVELVAYGSSGKSWMAADAALSVATGEPWLGRFATKPGPALLLDWENGAYEARRRLHAIARARDLGSVEGVALASMPSVYMSSPEWANAIGPLAEQYRLITIDTLKAANPGVDENDSNMRTGLDALSRIGEKTGCSFLVLVHSKKTSGALTAIDAREAGRGSSAIFDAADLVLHVTYAEGEPLRVQQTKARIGRQIDPFQVTIEDTENGGVLVSASDVPAAASESSSDRFDAACVRVLEAVREWPGSSKATVREKLGMRNTTVQAALDRLARDGAIRNVGSRQDQKWFPTGAGGQLEE